MPEITVHIPHELESESHRIKRFIDAMVHKLHKNAHKSGFEQADIRQCLRRIREESEELEQAIAEGNVLEIILEAADCANFALIASVAAIERTPEVVVTNPHSHATGHGIKKNGRKN